MTITLYHNARCSKSRRAKALLEENGAEIEVIDYLEDPPSAGELDRILGLLGVEPRDLIRSGEDAYRELGLADPGLARGALIDAMATHPRLIQRPIAIRSDRAVIGRPPENVLELL